MFVPAGLSPEVTNQIRCNGLMQDANDQISLTISQFKFAWQLFWDSGLTVQQMQAQLDYMSTETTFDNNQTIPTLQAYFAKALRFIAYAEVEVPTAFADSVPDISGALLPGTTTPYMRYLTPGWIYTVDGSGRIVVSAPCNFG